MKIRVDWDVTDDEHPKRKKINGLPTVVNVPAEVVAEEKEQSGSVADWLSDKYGWCVNGWKEI